MDEEMEIFRAALEDGKMSESPGSGRRETAQEALLVQHPVVATA